MRVLLACECSGVARRAFQKLGHIAYSCDLATAEDGATEFHIIGDAVEVSRRPGWDFMFANPECRFLCNSGVLRLYIGGKLGNGRDESRWSAMRQAAAFFVELSQAPIPKIVMENSIMHGYAKALIDPHLKSWTRQTVQPYEFGDDASKRTLLIMKNCGPLRPTSYVQPRIIDGKPRWANQTDSGQNRLGPSPTRSAQRARTYPGIAAALAEQLSEVSA